MEETIDLKSLLMYFWKRRKQVLYVAILVFLMANIVFLVFKGFVYSNVGMIESSSNSTAEKITSYNDIILSDSFIESAIANSSIDANVSYIKKNLSISSNIGSRFYTISLNYNNRNDGKRLCESIINKIINEIQLYDGDNVHKYSEIVTSNNPINFNIVKNELLYFLIGCVIGLGYVFVIYFFDKKIKSQSELSKLNVLGTIVDSKKDKNRNKINLIKTKIILSKLGNVIFLNTARDINCKYDIISLVDEFSKDSKVLLIDTNIRCNITKDLGYSDLLKNYKEDLANYIHCDGKLDIMKSGTCSDEPEVLLASKNNEKIISYLKKKYDYVFLYNSNVIDYSDSLLISRLCDCNYMIAGINQTDKRDFERAIDLYNQVGIKVNGVIIIEDKEERRI